MNPNAHFAVLVQPGHQNYLYMPWGHAIHAGNSFQQCAPNPIITTSGEAEEANEQKETMIQALEIALEESQEADRVQITWPARFLNPGC
jgi:hypothetical protein